MSENIPEQEQSTLNMQSRSNPYYSSGSKLEAHIIADMLRIESIATEMREHKVDYKEHKFNVNKRFDKLENWIITIVAISVTSLLGILGSLIVGGLGG